MFGGGQSREGKVRANEAIEVGALGRCAEQTLVDRQWHSEITVEGATPELDKQQLIGFVIPDAGQYGGFDGSRNHRRTQVKGALSAGGDEQGVWIETAVRQTGSVGGCYFLSKNCYQIQTGWPACVASPLGQCRKGI